MGRWYCIECAKWFEGENSLVTHQKGKNHKRRSVCLQDCFLASSTDCSYRVKALQDEPYTQKEAEAAVGLSTDNGSHHKAHGTVVDMEVEMEIIEQHGVAMAS